MTTIEKLTAFAKEINSDWTPEYSALVQDSELRVKYKDTVIAIVDERFEIEMLEDDFDETYSQLEYMLER